jgi:hypothetical protein
MLSNRSFFPLSACTVRNLCSGKAASCLLQACNFPHRSPLHRLHVDLMGPINPLDFRGERFLMVATDVYSGYLAAVALAWKADTFGALTELITLYERQLQPFEL